MREGEIDMTTKVTGGDYFSLGLLAFGGLGIEVLYAYFLEPMLYGGGMQDWSVSQNIVHWIITCVTWGVISYILVKMSKDKYAFDLFAKVERMKLWQWGCVAVCIIFSIMGSYISWDGFKVIKEFQNKGALLFVFQYIYYAVETVLFMLIIIFTQKAFEVWFKRKDIPYGGIICGITWGFAHAFTKGSIMVGLEGILLGFLLGVAYLLVNRSVKKTYVVLFIMFAL